jgi:hypothetical protein
MDIKPIFCLLLHRYNILIILTILIFIKGAFAAYVGLSPSNVNLSSEINEEVCETVYIFSDNNKIIANDYWSKKQTRKINEFNINKKDLGIISRYNKENTVNGRLVNEICFKSKKPGKYYGLIIYNIENKTAGVGLFVNYKVNGEIKNDLVKISGMVISDTAYSKIFLITPTIFLIILLIFLILFKKFK